MSKYHLPARSVKTLRALIEVVKPRKPEFDPPVEDHMLEFLDEFYSYFPFHLKIAFPLGLVLLEYATIIFAGSLKPFSAMDLEKRDKYVSGWVNSSLMLRRDLIKGVKGVCLTAYYAHPDVMAHIGFDLPAHMDRINKGEACDQEACDFFRGLGYDRNSRIPYPAYDKVDLITHDTPPPEGEAG